MNEDRTHGDSSAINDDEPLPRPPSSEPIAFGYTNYRGEQATRRAIPVRLYWGKTEYHPDEQWLFEAYDVEKHAMRDFALRGCDFTNKSSIAKIIAEHDAAVSDCPFGKPKPPSHEESCRKCGGTSFTGCFLKAREAGRVVQVLKERLKTDG